MKVHHTGIIVNSIDKEVELYKALGYSVYGDIVNDEIQCNKILFLQMGNEKIELIEPMDSKSSVYNLPKGYAHICYEVKDLDAHINDFKEKRIGVVFTEKLTAPAIDNRAIVFAYLKNKTIVEFVETEH